jgi:hypothetical protein
MKLRVISAVLLTLATVAVTAIPAYALEPVVVVATDAVEIGPMASTTYLSWTEVDFDRRVPRAAVWVEAIGSDEPFRVNPPGTFAFTGGIDGSTMVYQISDPTPVKPDIAMMDLDTRTSLEVPDGINTRRAEYAPTISANHILFARGIRQGASIILFDTSTGDSEVLYSKRRTQRRLFEIIPTQVNGNFAVWQQVVHRLNGSVVDGDIWLYDIALGTTTKLPTEPRVWEYGPSVSADGTVYFGRSNPNCGEDAEMVERSPDGTETTLYTFPVGEDFSFSSVVDNPNGTVDVYFDQGSCTGDDWGDILKLSGI